MSLSLQHVELHCRICTRGVCSVTVDLQEPTLNKLAAAVDDMVPFSGRIVRQLLRRVTAALETKDVQEIANEITASYDILCLDCRAVHSAEGFLEQVS